MTKSTVDWAVIQQGGVRPERASVAALPPLGKNKSLRTRRARFGVMLFAPAFLLTAAVAFYPVGYALFTSFFTVKYFRRTNFVGLANYTHFWQDSTAVTSLINTLIFTAGSLLIVLPLGFALALALNRSFRGRTVFRTIITLPWVITLVVVALIWQWLLNVQYGPIAQASSEILGAPLDAFGTPHSALIAMIITNVWQTYPYAMLLLLAGLQTIPQNCYEAAAIDGAGPLARVRSITLPLLKRHVLVVVIMLSVHYVNMVTLPLILTNGGPQDGTLVMSLHLFHQAFVAYNFGYASAMAIYLCLFNGVFVTVYALVLRRKD